MGRARDLASQAIFVNDTGNDSYIINGDMRVQQRGYSNSTARTSGGYYTADRWRYTQIDSFGTDVQPIIGYNTSANNGEFTNSLTFTTGVGSTAATADVIYFDQRIEGQNLVNLRLGTASAQPMTLSFWVKSSLTGTFGVGLNNYTQTSATTGIVGTYTINTAATWEYKTITFPAPLTGTFDTDNTTGLVVAFDMGGGSDYELSTTGVWTTITTSVMRTPSCVQLTATTGATWEMTGVKLEKGIIATPFKHESYAENLAKCQRYFAAFGGYPNTTGNTNGVRIYSEKYSTGSASFVDWDLPVVMRDTPTEQLYATSGHNGGGVTDWSSKEKWRLYDSDDPAWIAYDIRVGAEL